jgi:hypothetical protein
LIKQDLPVSWLPIDVILKQMLSGLGPKVNSLPDGVKVELVWPYGCADFGWEGGAAFFCGAFLS